MTSYRISEDAERDLDEIFLYWAGRAGVDVADRVTDEVISRFWLLGEFPNAGRASDEIAPGVRCFPAGNYLIYYRKRTSVAEILHIFHAARDQKRAFRKSRKTS